MAEKTLIDVMITRGTRIPVDGEMQVVGPKDGKPAKVSVAPALGRQIVESRRGEWADGGPPETATDEKSEKAARGPARTK